MMDLLADLVCGEDDLPLICESVFFLLMGFDKAQLNETLLDTIVHHCPSGSSARTIVHYAQGVNTGMIWNTICTFNSQQIYYLSIHINLILIVAYFSLKKLILEKGFMREIRIKFYKFFIIMNKKLGL